MIFNQWYLILDSKELTKTRALRIKRLNLDLALWRDQENRVCCIADKCCHRGASLSCGKVIHGCLECPFHGFLYDKSGQVKVIPANGRNNQVSDAYTVPSYTCYENYGYIWMWWGDSEKITGEPFFFKELANFSWSGFKDHWNVHYSRAIENQLDVVHVPFVHKTTIGRGNKTLVHGPVVTLEKELLTFYVNNVEDDGRTVPLKADEIKDYTRLFHLQFHFPNIWQNFISEKIRAFAAFVPVDEENTIIYIRYYQNLVRIPLLKGLMNYIGKISSLIILRQDKRVVLTQIPKKTALKMGEILIPGDSPIIEYRKHRDALLKALEK
jgi:phenylpropionate dioxygenase-like ring-hydroxylating dioxygenase large terminal subunit